jgi:hypothetical protein
MIGHSSIQTYSRSVHRCAAWTIVVPKKVDELLSSQSTNTAAGILIQGSIDKLALAILKLNDAVFHSSLYQNSMNTDRFLLADSVCTVNSLHFYKWVPV